MSIVALTEVIYIAHAVPEGWNLGSGISLNLVVIIGLKLIGLHRSPDAPLSGRRVVRELDAAISRRRCASPITARTDLHGEPALVAGVRGRVAISRAGNPTQNAFVEISTDGSGTGC